MRGKIKNNFRHERLSVSLLDGTIARIPYNFPDFPRKFEARMWDENVPLERLEIRSEVGVLQR